MINVHPSQMVGRTFAELGIAFVGEHGKKAPIWDEPFRDAVFERSTGDGKKQFFLISSVPYFHPETWSFEGNCGIVKDITHERSKKKH